MRTIYPESLKEEVGQSIIHYINTIKMEKSVYMINFISPNYSRSILVSIRVNIKITFKRRLALEIKITSFTTKDLCCRSAKAFFGITSFSGTILCLTAPAAEDDDGSAFQ